MKDTIQTSTKVGAYMPLTGLLQVLQSFELLFVLLQSKFPHERCINIENGKDTLQQDMFQSLIWSCNSSSLSLSILAFINLRLPSESSEALHCRDTTAACSFLGMPALSSLVPLRLNLMLRSCNVALTIHVVRLRLDWPAWWGNPNTSACEICKIGIENST